MSSAPKIGLMVGLPFIGRPVAFEWSFSLACHQYPMNTNVMFSTLKGQPIDEARNAIVEHALREHAKWLWFLDDDVAAPFDAAVRLIYTLNQADDNTMVVGGIYCAKRWPTEPLVFRGDGQGAFWDWKYGDVFEVTGIGTGCMMIKTEVFEHLEKPYFKTIHETPERDTGVIRRMVTDDLYFCQKVIAAGYKIIADSNVMCLHWDADKSVAYMLPDDSYPMRKNGHVA